jgi:hypothetical protein
VTVGERKRYVYIAATGRDGWSDRGATFDYATLENAVLSALRELRPGDVTGEPAKADDKQAEVIRLSARVLDLDDRIERTRQRARTANDFDVLLDLIVELQAERRQVAESLADLQREETSSRPASLGEAHSLIDLLARAAPEQREELRRRLKTRIRQLVSEMRVLIVCRGRRDRVAAVQLFFAGGACRNYLVAHRAGSRSAASNAWPHEVGQLDLRQSNHAARLEAALLRVDVGQP